MNMMGKRLATQSELMVFIETVSIPAEVSNLRGPFLKPCLPAPETKAWSTVNLGGPVVEEDIPPYLEASRYREAFELLLDRYQHKAFRLAYSMLGDEASAEEIAQDAFLQIWKALPSF